MLGDRGVDTQYDKQEHVFGECVEVLGNVYGNPGLLEKADPRVRTTDGRLARVTVEGEAA
jgi:hypothetical protein